MTTLVQVCNMALGRLGTHQFISSLQDQSTLAGTCRAFLDEARRSCLAEYDPPFAKVLVPLAMTSNVPPPPWGVEYARPACIKVRSLAILAPPVAFGSATIPSGSASYIDFGGPALPQGGPAFQGLAQPYIAGDPSPTIIPFTTGAVAQASPGSGGQPGGATPVIWTNALNAGAWCTIDVTDPNAWEAGFATAYSWFLAAEMAVNITGSAQVQDAMMQGAMQAMRKASTTEGNEESQTASWDADWIDARGDQSGGWGTSGGGYAGGGGYATGAAAGSVPQAPAVPTAALAALQTMITNGLATETARAEAAEAALNAAVASAVTEAVAAAAAAARAAGATLTVGTTTFTGFNPAVFSVGAGGQLQTINPIPLADQVQITSSVGTDGNTTFTAGYLPPDGITIIPNAGALSVNAEPILNLADRGTIALTDTVVISSQAGTSYSGSVNELVTALSFLSYGINIDQVASQPPNTPFLVTGELTRYAFVPTLSETDQGGTLTLLSSLGGTATAANGSTPGTFSFTHPGLAVTSSFTFTVQDANGVTATSNAFAVSGSIPVSASLSNIPATAVHGTPITGVTGTMSPATGATAWVVLYGPSGFELPRVAWNGGSAVPNMTPLATGNYKYNVFTTATGGTKLFAQSTPTAVS